MPMAAGVCDFLVAFRFLGVIRTRGVVDCIEQQKFVRMEPYKEKIVGAELWRVVELLPSKTGGGGSLAHPRWAALRTQQVCHWTAGSFSGGTSVADGMAALMAAGACCVPEGIRFLRVIRMRGVVGCVEQ